MARTVLSVVVGLVLLLASVTTAERRTESELTGLYSCEGMNPDGSPYAGVVEIAKLHDTYLVRWTMSNRDQVMGVGIYSGGVLAVSYFAQSPALAVYSAGADGKLDGKWTIGAAGMMFSETLTKMVNAEPKPESTKPEPTKPVEPTRRPTRSSGTTEL